jgi:hypothetical protein
MLKLPKRPFWNVLPLTEPLPRENTLEVLVVLPLMRDSMLLTTPTEQKGYFQGKQGLELKIIYYVL